MFQDRPRWYMGSSAFWFATSLKWFLIMLLLPSKVNEIVPEHQRNGMWGLVLTIGAIEACFGPAILGGWSDRIQRRIPFLLIGACLTAVACFTLFHAQSIPVLIFGYLMLQVADDVATGPYAALIPSLVPEQHLGHATGTLASFQAAGQIVGAIMLVVAGKSGREALLISLAGLSILCASIVWRTIRHDPPSVQHSENEVTSPAWKTAAFRWVWLTRFAVSLGFSIMVSFGVNFLSDRVRTFDIFGLVLKDAESAAGALALVLALFGVFGALAGGGLADRFDRRRVVSYACLFMTAAMLPFTITTHFPAILGLGLAFGLAYGAYNASDFALASSVIPDVNKAGRDLGIWQASIAVPQIFMRPIGAQIDALNKANAGSGYATAFLIAAGLLVLASISVRKVRYHQEKVPPQGVAT